MDFDNIDDLLEHLSEEIKDSLKNDVGDKVVEKMKHHIETDVYAIDWKGRKYERKKSQGGLLDENNISREMISEDTLEVMSVRTDIQKGMYKDVSEIVETGVGFWDSVPEIVKKGRPFTQNTIDELERTNEHVEAMEESLKKKGLDVK